MAYEVERALYKEDKFKRLNYTANAILHFQELVRLLDKKDDISRQSTLDFLYTYISEANYPEGGSATARHYVDSPQADQKPYPGRWRLVSNAWDPRLSAFVQTLREGYARTIDWTEAFIVGGSDKNAVERTLVVQWREVDPNYIAAMVTTLRTAESFTGPVVQGNTYAGKWWVSEVQPTQFEDGSAIITMTLALVNSYTSLTYGFLVGSRNLTETTAGFQRQQVIELRRQDPDTIESTIDTVRGVESYTDPTVEGATLSGIWWLSDVRPIDDPATGTKTLQLVLTLTNSSTSLADGFITGGKGMTAQEQSLEVQLRWHHPRSIAADVATLRAVTSYTDPTVEEQTATGKWIISDVHPVDDQATGTKTIVLSLSLVATVADLAALAALTPLKQHTHDIDHPFGPGGTYTAHVGKSYHDGIVYTYKQLDPASRDVLIALTDAQLQTLIPVADQATYEFTDRDIKDDEADHTLTMKVAFKRVGRIAWTDQAADMTEYENQGTPNETRTKMWFGIRNADDATVVAALINAAGGGALTGETGYNVASVRYTNNDDGTKTWTQVLLKEKKGALGTELEAGEIAQINPHGWEPGTLNTVQIVNENLWDTANAYDVLAAANVGYTFVRSFERAQSNGLWSVYYIYEKPVFYNNTPTFYDVASNDGTDQGGTTKARALLAPAISIGLLENRYDAIAPTSGYALGRKTKRDNRDGSGDLTKEEVRIRGSTEFYTVSTRPAYGNVPKTKVVHWFDLSDAVATAIHDDFDAKPYAAATWLYGPAAMRVNGYIVRSIDKIPHRENLLYDVMLTSSYVDLSTFVPAEWVIGWDTGGAPSRIVEATMYAVVDGVRKKRTLTYHVWFYNGPTKEACDAQLAVSGGSGHNQAALVGTQAGSSTVFQINAYWWKAMKITAPGGAIEGAWGSDQ